MSRLDQLKNLLTDSPNDAFLLFALAKEYEGSGNNEQALQHYLNLRQTSPDYVGLYYHLGKLYEQLEQAEQALEAYSEGLGQAQKAGDRHAWSELSSAKLNLEMEM